MQKISLNYNRESLYDLLKNYYELSKIKTALFDETGHKIIQYPDSDCSFCKLMKSKAKTKKLCDQSDKTAFEIVKRKKELIIYHCHANLVEASAPLIQNGNVIGYMMFGQISDKNDRESFYKHIDELLEAYDFAIKNNDIYKGIKFRTQTQIKAAAKLLETCTFYVLLKDIVKLSSETFISKLDDYIENNIEKDISISDLVDYFGIPKTRLYEQFNEYSKLGIAQYIKNKRIEKAKMLLQTTNYKVVEISEKVGFYDYNYFCRCFKKVTGKSAKKFRNDKNKTALKAVI